MDAALNLASAQLITGVADEPELVGAWRSTQSGVGHSSAFRAPRTLLRLHSAQTNRPGPFATMPYREPACWPAERPASGFEPECAGHRARGKRGDHLPVLRRRRARVDLRSPVVVRALRLDGVAPRPVSRALLDTVPEVPEITLLLSLGSARRRPCAGSRWAPWCD